MIREAIDVAFPVDPAQKLVAAKAILEAEPIPAPDVAELRGRARPGSRRRLVIVVDTTILV